VVKAEKWKETEKAIGVIGLRPSRFGSFACMRFFQGRSKRRS